jgi:bifunctional non-homologous end joining protein LigD
MLWRVSPGRSRRTPPVGFILPCQPLLVDKPPAGSGWLHEVKHDGYRIIARKEGNRVTLWSRYGTNFTDRLPKIAEAVCSLAAESALIDGEAVAVRPDGHSDFAALRTKAGSARACFVAFDLLTLNGEDFRKRPIEERRAALSPLVAGVHCILFSDALVAEGALVFAKACQLGLEGIVSKRAGSQYSSGNSRRWLKSKNPAFVRRS